MPFPELLTVTCSECSRSLTEAHAGPRRVSHIPSGAMKHTGVLLFQNHTDAAKIARAVGWYVDGFEEVCAECLKKRRRA